MTFFMNPFTHEFRGAWILGDRSYMTNFNIAPNSGRGPEHVIAWLEPPYDLSGNDADANSRDTLVLQYTIDRELNNWVTLSIDITADAASAAAVEGHEIVTSLNNDGTFSSFFTASVDNFPSGRQRLNIKQKLPVDKMRFYIVNGRAEEALRFNQRAGVAEAPTYFSRHQIRSAFTAAQLDLYPDSLNSLIELDPVGNTVDADAIDNALGPKGLTLGLDSSTVREDWELLEGRSGLFQFTSGPSGNAVSTTNVEIIYHAGAQEGDLATKITTQLDASSDVVARFEEPYTLQAGDLITPP